MEINKIYNEINILTMKRMDDNFIDGVICSPPYNISSKRKDMYYNTGYSDVDNLSTEDYIKVRINEFREFSRVLKSDGVIAYNLSYIHENPILPTTLVSRVHEETDLTLSDIIYWKKSNAIPFQTSPNKLSRIVEPVYIFVHKDRLSDFKANKEISKVNEKTGQKFYKNYTNYIEAKNNDSFKTTLKAVYSSELVEKIIDTYFPTGSIIYDPFMGSGTTAIGCMNKNINYIGSELKEDHYIDTLERIKQYAKKTEVQ